jgi:hypothetical protein
VFIQGSLLLFTPFKFKNNTEPKDKFFLVLRISDDGQMVVAPLPTSVNRLPLVINKPHGCIDVPERCHNCYLFEPGKIICDSGFSFNKPTFIYSNDIDSYEIDNLKANYPLIGRNYQEMGILHPAELEALLDCIKNSSSVKRRVKRMLFS